MSGSQRLVMFIPMVAALLTGCDGRLIAAGNLTLAVIPLGLLWVTVNLKKAR